ncbi:hypothetical protein [Fusobacterium ulcerans]|uniref:hypothetical protein n=1 Tax=Fusobacterium ulcerans TaxID=861 RepID=UPI002E794259|nr:hypothetical protein [Fusobacterium ulcerans]MEE0137637.1 hypothetical protein [Fusobacterium ulcerans]
MKAFNSGNRKSKLIVRFLKGVGSVSLTSPMLDNGIAKKKDNGMSLKRAGFGCRPLVWKLADFIGNRGIILNISMKRSPYGISNAQAYLKEMQSMEVSRKVASKWLNDYETGNGNRYKVYCWVSRKNK